MSKKKMLVAGASGLVGFAAVKHFAQLTDWVLESGAPNFIPSTLLRVGKREKT